MTEVSEAGVTVGATPATDLVALTTAHNARMAAIDRLIPAGPMPALTPSVNPAPAYGTVTEELLAVPGAAGVARWSTVDPDSLTASWGSLARYGLVSVRVAGDLTDAAPAGGNPSRIDAATSSGTLSAAAAMDALLARWVERRPGSVDADALAGGDTAAGLMWPSRDTTMTRPFLDHGLSPIVTLAARPAHRPPPPSTPTDGLVIRPLAERDVDVAAHLFLEVIRWDAQFGAVTVRPSAAPRSRDEVIALLARHRTSAWVAESAGDVVGLVTVEWPPDSGWLGRLVDVDPLRLAYLGCMSVAPGRRSNGIGAALAGRVHDELDVAGVEMTVLHHSATNPLSVPFWHRWGYRPLWTGWDVRPYSALR